MTHFSHSTVAPVQVRSSFLPFFFPLETWWGTDPFLFLSVPSTAVRENPSPSIDVAGEDGFPVNDSFFLRAKHEPLLNSLTSSLKGLLLLPRDKFNVPSLRSKKFCPFPPRSPLPDNPFEARRLLQPATKGLPAALPTGRFTQMFLTLLGTKSSRLPFP